MEPGSITRTLPNGDVLTDLRDGVWGWCTPTGVDGIGVGQAIAQRAGGQWVAILRWQPMHLPTGAGFGIWYQSKRDAIGGANRMADLRIPWLSLTMENLESNKAVRAGITRWGLNELERHGAFAAMGGRVDGDVIDLLIWESDKSMGTAYSYARGVVLDRAYGQ